MRMSYDTDERQPQAWAAGPLVPWVVRRRKGMTYELRYHQLDRVQCVAALIKLSHGDLVRVVVTIWAIW